MPLYGTKNRFLGSGPLVVIDHRQAPQKAHLHLIRFGPYCDLWARRKNLFVCACVCVCVFASIKTQTSRLCPYKMDDLISVKLCTTTRLPDVMIYFGRFLNIFNRWSSSVLTSWSQSSQSSATFPHSQKHARVLPHLKKLDMDVFDCVRSQVVPPSLQLNFYKQFFGAACRSTSAYSL